jgi:DNA-binding transcriptional MerR regulator
MTTELTIGALAKQVGVRTSALRFYEEQGLLSPAGRNESGYRVYGQDAIARVQRIQRAQRLGFSLSDIRPLLDAWDTGDLSDAAILSIAENRYLALEKQVTDRLVLQHELASFLQDLDRRKIADLEDTAFDKLLERVCADPNTKTTGDFMLNWIMERAGCNLTSEEGRAILQRLEGQHVHIWQENEAYQILFISQDPQVAQGLADLAALEADCETHAHTVSHFNHSDEGFLFTASGTNAFIFARLGCPDHPGRSGAGLADRPIAQAFAGP